ncbi:MAG: hypothetical protein BWK79_02170 [Beggiatoa sp. IS2]|nr:MAG: hypothetical protein BWK79_02170 [Beggiatoa sp. IS2]
MSLNLLTKSLSYTSSVIALVLLTSCVEMPNKMRDMFGASENPPPPIVPASYTVPPASKTTRSVSDKRVALVIGNGNYSPGFELNNPPNDAKDMAKTLREMGFEVVYGENTDQQTMKSLVQTFAEKLQDASLGLFFFAGHGTQYGRENFLLPIDVSNKSDREIQQTSLAADHVLATMERVGTPTKIIILDACRNTPGGSGLAEMTPQTQHESGAFIAYSTAPGKTANDGTGRNSPFTKGLLQFISQGLPIEILFKKVRTAVKAETRGQQIPWEHTSLDGGNLCLAPCVEGSSNASGQCQMRVGKGLYEGECQNGVAHGQGVMRYTDGEYYQGTFSNGMRHGQGTQYLVDSTEMAGNWVNGKIR